MTTTPSSDPLLPGNGGLWTAAQTTTAARGWRLHKWGASDKAALKATLEYVRRSYKTPGATFPRLVPYGCGIVCGPHQVAQFTSFDIANQAESIARQAAEACGLPV